MSISQPKNIGFFRDKPESSCEKTENQRKKSNAKKWILISAGAFLLVIIAILIGQYRIWMAPNLLLPNSCEGDSIKTTAQHITLKVCEGDTFDTLMQQLSPYLVSPSRFEKVAKWSKYPSHIRSGNYVFKEGMSNREMLQILKRGLQTPVRITFSVVRTPEQLAGILSRQLMVDSASIIAAFHDRIWLNNLSLTIQTLPAFFIPDTYEVWWNCSTDKLMHSLERAYIQYWTEERKALVEANGLTPIEAATLASIVQDETNRPEEWPIVAGLYLNRLRKGMPLQACPTIKYVMNDFSMRRVLKEYTVVESPYNTYIHRGLPPGPIGIASKQVLEAVVRAKPNNYLYMCAKDDFSGGHYFSTNLTQHNIYANRYHAALTQKRIW